MAKTITVKDAAALWGISERRISLLCNEGRIKGAFKKGRTWQIPKTAKKPLDQRVKSGTYRKKSASLLPLPVGISDYRTASSEYYYVDKTLLIKEFLDERPKVSLFTRPRRFGKTLNMDMIRTFFEKTDENTSVFFRNKKIWKQGEKYRDYQGKYPVIFISFKDAKKDSWDKTLEHIIQVITEEYKRHTELKKGSKILDRDFYDKVISGTLDRNQYDSSLYMLSKMLHEHYEISPVVIIDEYDTPIQQGHAQGFYDSAILFMRNLFSGVLKDNKHLSFGFMTGILRVAKESIFSGLNNLIVNSVLDNKYSEYFGFTSAEVKAMAAYYHAGNRFNEICKWYDGYRFGDTEIFNPWSVINYFRNDCRPGAYWQATGNNEIIGEVLSGIDEEITDKLNCLLQGESVVSVIDIGVIYPEVRRNPSSVFSFLLVAGYLKSVKTTLASNGDHMCEMALPNKEISFVYRKEILQKLEPIIPGSSVSVVQEALYTADPKRLASSLESLLMQSASHFDTAGENFYHGFCLGLCATLEPYRCDSNKEAGDGRYDIMLTPMRSDLPGIVIELKAAKKATDDDLQKLAITALKQITQKKYDVALKAAGVKKTIRYGVAFCGKHVTVKSSS